MEAMKLFKVCMRTENPGDRSILTSWKQQLCLVTAISSFRSSETPGARSPVSEITLEVDGMPVNNIHRCVGLWEEFFEKQFSWSTSPETSIKTFCAPQTITTNAPNEAQVGKQLQIWSTINHQARLTCLQPFLRMMVTFWSINWLCCMKKFVN